ncbi:MAG: GNAT family N-acetyltransferase [Anaerolineales bacterium]|nr:GNAT family N-acetyltransferase [Anaerolineales bacterium]
MRRDFHHVRAITPGDLRSIMRMVDTAWRVHIRVPPVELGAKIKVMPGFLAEDQTGLRGFIVMEPQRPHVALIIAAGLRDSWSVRPYLDLLLPEIEEAVQLEGLPAVAHIGNVAWLVDDLQRRGFEIREWIVAFERHGSDAPPAVPRPALIRSAHYSDMPELLALDGLAFNHIWRKSAGNFNEALARADSFAVAELDGQIVGYEWFERYHKHAHLTRLAVHPAYQGRGIGAQLLHTAITDALASGANMITLNTQENNYRSRALYERFGFVFSQQRMPVLWKELG